MSCSLIASNSFTAETSGGTFLLTTFRLTVNALQDGKHVLIFPECYEPYNHIVNAFQDKFVDVAKLYHKRTGNAVNFVPLYIAPKLKKMYIGKPTAFSPTASIKSERERICRYIADEITAIAESLPLHTVVPYANIPKKCYKTNRMDEVPYEKTNGWLPSFAVIEYHLTGISAFIVVARLGGIFCNVSAYRKSHTVREMHADLLPFRRSYSILRAFRTCICRLVFAHNRLTCILYALQPP